MSKRPQVSVIIPTLNEARTLSSCLNQLKNLLPAPLEIIVVDGGSVDETVKLARGFDITVLESKKQGRAAQMHLGARSAKADQLVFLHADTCVPKDLIQHVNRTLSNRKVALGGFISIMKGEKTRRWFSFLNYIKTYLCPMFYRPHAFFCKGLKLLFGDQVLFCRKEDYLKSGGFDEEDVVMEEASFCLKMNQLGRVKMLHRFVYSSDRRVAQWGFWRANRIYFFIAFGWVFGKSQHKLSEAYSAVR